ncbi:N-acetylglucosamine kinase [Opitutus terrae]|uniref:ATPase BadF/BadG/BcrA/BcrD type n=1 Tax=Opitutus terrae (strain DSM 11246 / JCM 15787 / PB90-1) TaxID=452637 RepID=B1ZVN0_OPITP|nr:BadF/BadG/BcrA/BcrD ATPase family protein [Opitutus terrae]ACB74127.1 ATPase BadF/BadG/BcrA/BcrD type [Opitutus terrae PB90-1]
MGSPSYKIGIDGGGTKTECILVDASGRIAAHRLAPGCNPSVVGQDQARLIVTDALCGLLNAARSENPAAHITQTQLFMAGTAHFWNEFASSLTDFGAVTAGPDSLPVLELATDGQPGLVLHSGTGSFVAARDRKGGVHYAGGLGWRFGDPGSAYDLGRRAISRALLELQGWLPTSRIGPTVRDSTGLGESADASAVTRYFYSDPTPNRKIAALAPAVLRLASEGDHSAHALIVESASELIDLAARVVTHLFSGVPTDSLRAGLSGPILTHPVVREVLAPRSPLPLEPVTATPIEGVRRLLLREG